MESNSHPREGVRILKYMRGSFSWEGESIKCVCVCVCVGVCVSVCVCVCVCMCVSE